MKNIHLQLPKPLLDLVDSVRGLVPRNAWIREAITEKLDRTIPTTEDDDAPAQ